MDIVWHKEQEWPERYLRPLLRRIIADWKEERASIDLFDKLADRQITKQDIWTTLTSPASYIARYWYYTGITMVIVLASGIRLGEFSLLGSRTEVEAQAAL